jgi:hypothetical protein
MWLDAPNKGIHRMVFVLTLAITAVAALLQSHAHSAFAYSPFEPEKTKALKEFGVSCGTVPEYGKANGPYLRLLQLQKLMTLIRKLGNEYFSLPDYLYNLQLKREIEELQKKADHFDALMFERVQYQDHGYP